MTNAAAIGYMILAAKTAGLDRGTARLLAALMSAEMDLHTEWEAEEAYCDFWREIKPMPDPPAEKAR